MAISPNLSLAAKYVGAGALLGVGVSAVYKGVDKFDDPGNKVMNIGAGIAATAAGIGVWTMGSGRMQALPFASGGNALGNVAKSIGMLGAFVGAAALVNHGLDSIDD
jgi:hypothetical protein